MHLALYLVLVLFLRHSHSSFIPQHSVSCQPCFPFLRFCVAHISHFVKGVLTFAIDQLNRVDRVCFLRVAATKVLAHFTQVWQIRTKEYCSFYVLPVIARYTLSR
uniref:Secreted protein n=1 Tax=Rhipicephalus zambeziensis TaxID=60191 RepID=A0A224Y7N1_9ACAR